jgi:hypothetical protein
MMAECCLVAVQKTKITRKLLKLAPEMSRTGMSVSFLKGLKNRLVSPKANISLKLNKSGYATGEDMEGVLAVSSSEDFQAAEIRCEIQCVEEARRTKRVYDENLRMNVDRQVTETATLFAAKPNVSGGMAINNGYSGIFPFKVNIPAGGRPTFRGVDNRVTWTIKGVIAVKDRPDVVSSVSEIQVAQPTVVQAAPTVQAAPVVKEVIREIVMIPCRYCGGLMPQTETTCPKCGAKRTA